MSKRTIIGALAGIATIATLSSATGAIAATPKADPALVQCTVTVHAPARISIGSALTTVPYRLSGCEGRLEVAVAQVSDPFHKFWDALGWPPRTSNATFKITDAPPVGTYSDMRVEALPGMDVLQKHSPLSFLAPSAE